MLSKRNTAVEYLLQLNPTQNADVDVSSAKTVTSQEYDHYFGIHPFYIEKGNVVFKILASAKFVSTHLSVILLLL